MPINSFDRYPLTWKPEKATLKQPYYKALSEDLERKIKSGLLKAGTKLPPQREIADYLDLNDTTITRVYEICKRKGLIYGTTGKGTFVSPHASEDVTIGTSRLSDMCIEMGAVNSFSEYCEPVEQATQSVIKKGYLRNLYEYSYPSGHPHQLAAVIQKNHLILVEDDISSWLFAADGRTFPSMFDILDGQSVYICGMTKSLCPGLRIAYMTFGEQLKDAILHGLWNVNIKASSLDAEIITELILNGDAYKIAAQKLLWAKRNCRLYAKYFPDPCEKDGDVSYYKWLPTGIQKPFYEMEADLSNLGVRVYHSDRFAVAANGGQSFLRVSLCSVGNTQKLERGLMIIKDYLDREGEAHS